jgi:hypothetical protein
MQNVGSDPGDADNNRALPDSCSLLRPEQGAAGAHLVPIQHWERRSARWTVWMQHQDPSGSPWAVWSHYAYEPAVIRPRATTSARTNARRWVILLLVQVLAVLITKLRQDKTSQAKDSKRVSFRIIRLLDVMAIDVAQRLSEAMPSPRQPSHSPGSLPRRYCASAANTLAKSPLPTKT